MEVTIKQRTWTPYTYISEETMIREGNELSNIIDDINVDFNSLEYTMDGIIEGSCVYTEATEGVITRLGRKIANMIRKFTNWINNIMGTTKMEDMNNIEKLEAITKKYPLIKDRVMVLAQKGLLDVSAIKDMNDFVEQYGKLDKWADVKELNNFQKHMNKLKAYANKYDDFFSGTGKVIKTSTEFIKSSTEFKKTAEKLMTDMQKVDPKAVEEGFDSMDKMMHRDNPEGYDSNSKPGKDSGASAPTPVTQEATEGPLRPLPLMDAQIVKFLQQIYNMIIKCFNIIAKWVVDALNKTKKNRQKVASVEVGIGRLLDKYGSFENIMDAYNKGKLKLPENVTIKGGKFIVDVSND